MKVMVVSSLESVRESLLAPLLRAGLATSIASGAHEALERVATSTPDAVVMDAQGSALDGLNLLKRLRNSSLGQHLPVMLVLSAEDTAERLLALKLGADDVLSAGWQEEELVARVQRSLARKQRFDALVEEGRKLTALSITDGLTQVNNHRFFRERLQEEFRRVQRYQDASALLFVDLDFFKDVNDVYGHLMGDQVLRTVAQTIRGCLRDVDVLARYGGEEFAILLPQTHLTGALTVAERIRRDIQALKMADDGKLRITASLGIATLPNPAITTADELVGTADAALYRAKREGRNRVQLAEPLPLPPELAASTSLRPR